MPADVEHYLAIKKDGEDGAALPGFESKTSPACKLIKSGLECSSTVSAATTASVSLDSTTNKQINLFKIASSSTAAATTTTAAALAAATTTTAAAASWLDLNWCKIRKIGIGLLNLGNNCYLNATLQCLAYTAPLSQWLVCRPHSPQCKIRQKNANNNNGAGFCALCEVERIIYDIFNSGNGCAKPNSLCFNIKKISTVFGVGTQEDASEFLTTLLESMAKSIKCAASNDASEPKPKKITTILDDIFSFQFRSRITCSNCGRVSDTVENTNTWPVDVKYFQDIRKAMVHFLREEVLDGENAYKCDKCNKKVKATKKYSIRTAPNILVVHLKRFDFTYAGKLSHFVTYPELLNMKQFVSTADTTPNSDELRNVSYKLYGVLVHLGYTSHSGHYYSYVRAPNDVWYKADDQQVSTVPAQDALGQNAYILFYAKVQPAAEGPKPRPTIPVRLSLVSLVSKPKESPAVNIPTHKPAESEEKFKSTFVPVAEPEPARVYGPTLPPGYPGKPESDVESTDGKPLNYNQVLRIKKLNKRKLRLLNKKKKLSELRAKRATEGNGNDAELSRRIRRLRKLVKREKYKIKKLKRVNREKEAIKGKHVDEDKKRKVNECSSSSSSDEDDSVSSLSADDMSSSGSGTPKKKPKSTSATDGLSLLKQYHSSSSAASSPERRPSSRSRRSSSSSSSSTSSSSSLSSLSSKLSQISGAKSQPADEPKADQSKAESESSKNDIFDYLKQNSMLRKWDEEDVTDDKESDPHEQNGKRFKQDPTDETKDETKDESEKCYSQINNRPSQYTHFNNSNHNFANSNTNFFPNNYNYNNRPNNHYNSVNQSKNSYKPYKNYAYNRNNGGNTSTTTSNSYNSNGWKNNNNYNNKYMNNNNHNYDSYNSYRHKSYHFNNRY